MISTFYIFGLIWYKYILARPKEIKGRSFRKYNNKRSLAHWLIWFSTKRTRTQEISSDISFDSFQKWHWNLYPSLTTYIFLSIFISFYLSLYLSLYLSYIYLSIYLLSILYLSYIYHISILYGSFTILYLSIDLSIDYLSFYLFYNWKLIPFILYIHLFYPSIYPSIYFNIENLYPLLYTIHLFYWSIYPSIYFNIENLYPLLNTSSISNGLHKEPHF